MRLLRDFLLRPPPHAERAPEAPTSGPVLARAATEGFARADAWAPPHAAASTIAPVVAVLAPAHKAAAVGAAVGLLLARRTRSGTALVAVWAADHPWPPGGSRVARPAARRLAAALDARGLEASAAGRLTTVVLPGDPVTAAAAAARAAAAAQGGPVVLALGGRAAAFDSVLAAQDRVLLVPAPDADPALTGLALAGLEDVGGPARACAADAAPLARAVVATGLTVPSSLRRSLGPALDDLVP